MLKAVRSKTFYCGMIRHIKLGIEPYGHFSLVCVGYKLSKPEKIDDFALIKE